jgi:hypothetical protein
MEIVYDILTGLLAGVALVVFIYFASKYQMKGWLSGAEKFLTNQYKSIKKEENDKKQKQFP